MNKKATEAPFDLSKSYVATDGWRGYEQPVYAVVGANDTGMFSDSPCRSDVADRELKDVEAILKKAGIPTKRDTCQTSNVFCVHHYIIVPPLYFEQAKKIVTDNYDRASTLLLYKTF